MDSTETTVVLQKLNPLTQYLVSVFSVVGEESSEPLKGTETTRMSSFSLCFCLSLRPISYYLKRSGPMYGTNCQQESEMSKQKLADWLLITGPRC